MVLGGPCLARAVVLQVLLQPYVTPSSALFLLGEAMQLDTDRLADACLRVIAQHLTQLAREPLFSELIRESAASVEDRQDIDSVPIVDDLRYHIVELHGSGDLSGRKFQIPNNYAAMCFLH